MKLDHGRSWSDFHGQISLDHEVGPWKDHGPTFMVWFLKNSVYKAFGPLTRCKLDVDREEWPCIKGKCVDFFNICPKRVVLKRKKRSSLTIPLSSLVFIFSSPKKTHSIFIITSFLCHGPLSFSTIALHLPLSLQNQLDHVADIVGLKICLLGTSNSMVTWHSFFDVNWSGLGMSSTTNHRFYRTSWSMV